MEIKQQLVSEGKYGIKCPYTMNPEGICIHNTANDSSALNEITYMVNNNNEVSFHFAVDDVEARQGIPLTRNAWASGDGNGNGNRKHIHIEICYSKSGGDRFIKSEINCAKLIAQLLKERGWRIDRVKKHQDFSGKYCPHRTLDLGWQRFLNMIQSELNGTPLINNNPTPTPQVVKPIQIAPQPKGQTLRIKYASAWSIYPLGVACVKSNSVGSLNPRDYGVNGILEYEVLDKPMENVATIQTRDYGKVNIFLPVGDNEWEIVGVIVSQPTPTPKPQAPVSTSNEYAEKGIFKFNTVVTVRTAPEENARTNVNYNVGDEVTYHTVILNKNGFNWIVYARGNNTLGYLKIKDLSNGESYGVAR